MTTDMEHLLNVRLCERFGDAADWAEVTSLTASLLRVVLSALGPEDAMAFLTAARHALDEEESRAGTIHLGFGAHLWTHLEDVSWGASALARASAWDAMLTMHRLSVLAPHPGLGAHVDSALEACRLRLVPAVAGF
ncbi:hypothetical protein [Streptomyces sp. TLI_105]|uniref:hypothetical protein n=1 Tax=Streptomyces sp. TLI_105 TaxID=1881019 RepID=UPI00089B30FD|nr:hypothetical protein [Streptomyces sp. TLI_105]SEE01844.1 hypothetical protein SAMN05428939_7063 [Streptomyces sp. TLI_105]